MVMQIGILVDRSGDRVVAEQLGFGEAVMPFLCREMALTDTHQRIQLPPCRLGQRGNGFAQGRRL